MLQVAGDLPRSNNNSLAELGLDLEFMSHTRVYFSCCCFCCVRPGLMECRVFECMICGHWVAPCKGPCCLGHCILDKLLVLSTHLLWGWVYSAEWRVLFASCCQPAMCQEGHDERLMDKSMVLIAKLPVINRSGKIFLFRKAITSILTRACTVFKVPFPILNINAFLHLLCLCSLSDL